MADCGACQHACMLAYMHTESVLSEAIGSERLHVILQRFCWTLTHLPAVVDAHTSTVVANIIAQSPLIAA